MGKSSNNPKFASANEGQSSGQAKPLEGMNVGGLPDAQVRLNVWGTAVMLSRQLRRNKSAGLTKWG